MVVGIKVRKPENYFSPKLKPDIPRGGRLGKGWYEDAIKENDEQGSSNDPARTEFQAASD